MTKQIIELETLTELVKIMGDDMSMLIDSYIADSRAKLAQLAELHPEADYESIFRLAHSLKGSSRNIGIAAFANDCEKIEELARAQALKPNDFDLLALNKTFEKAIDAVYQQLSVTPKS